MTADAEETTIELDRKTLAVRYRNQWAVKRLQPTGAWDLIASWSGGRRSLYQWCTANDVHPTAEAEATLSLLPENTGFKERV